MNLKENRHYANKYGVELNEYLKHNFNYRKACGLEYNAGIEVSSESWQERGWELR